MAQNTDAWHWSEQETQVQILNIKHSYWHTPYCETHPTSQLLIKWIQKRKLNKFVPTQKYPLFCNASMYFQKSKIEELLSSSSPHFICFVITHISRLCEHVVDMVYGLNRFTTRGELNVRPQVKKHPAQITDLHCICASPFKINSTLI